MNNRIAIGLFISILTNILLVWLGTWFVVKKGGFSYLVGKISMLAIAKSEDSKIPYPPYYLHRKNQFEILPNSDADIVFLGDSLTDEGEWAELLGNHHIKNRGISGDTTDRILKRLNTIVNSPPKTIFLMVGINDLITTSKSLESILADYQKILIEFQKHTPNTGVFIQSVLPVNNNLNGYMSDNERILQLNLSLKELAKKLKYQYIDVYSHLASSQNNLDAQYTVDGLHLNGEGYLVWKKVIEKYVKESCDSANLRFEI